MHSRVARIHGLLAGLNGLLGSSRWKRESLLAYQRDRLRALVRYACRNVPFYRDLYKAQGIGPNEIRTLEDIRRLPIISRQDLQRFGDDDLRAQGLSRRMLIERRTSGATGEPLRIWRTRAEEALLAAFRFRCLLMYGYRPWHTVASIEFLPENTRTVRKPGFTGRQPWPRFRIHCHLKPEDILSLLERARPRVIGGFPSVLDRLSERLEEEGWRPTRLLFIFTGAEPLTSRVRRDLSMSFGVPVYDRYGAQECRLIAFSCPQNPDRYHICQDSVAVESLVDGRPARPGEEGEVLVTSLHSRIMPFIRYRVGDLARLDKGPCSCGAPYDVLSAIGGRTIARFTRPDGSWLHVSALDQPLVELAPWIRRYRIVQKAAGLFVIEAVVERDPGAKAISDIARKIGVLIGGGASVSLELRDELPHNDTGKFELYRIE